MGWEFVFLTNSQVMLKQLVELPYFESHLGCKAPAGCLQHYPVLVQWTVLEVCRDHSAVDFWGIIGDFFLYCLNLNFLVPVFRVGRIKLLCLRNIFFLFCFLYLVLCTHVWFSVLSYMKRKLWIKPELIIDIWSESLGKATPG